MYILKSVKLQLVFGTEPDTQEEVVDVVPLVSRQLDDLSVLRVLHHCTITCKFLLTPFDNLLLVVLLVDALHRGERLSPVPLLNTDGSARLPLHRPRRSVYRPRTGPYLRYSE